MQPEQILRRPLNRTMLVMAIVLTAAAVLPHAWNVGYPIILYFFVVSALRLVLHQPAQARIRKWLILPLLLAGIAIAYSQYGIPLGARPGVGYLITLLALKIFEVTSRRDIYILTFLGFFTIATQFLFNSGLLFTLYLILVMMMLVWLLSTLNRDRPERRLAANLRTMATLAIPAIPVTLVLFYLFPRLATPLWELGSHHAIGVTGLSDSIRLGSISELSQSNKTAFRVTFEGAVPQQSRLYWRGPVLWQTDGRNWTAGDTGTQTPGNYQLLSGRVDYEVVLEASNKPWLFALDLPSSIPDKSRLTRDFRLITEQPVRDTLRYAVSSSTDFINTEFNNADRQRALQLPGSTSDRVRSLALTFKSASSSHRDFVNKVLTHFNEQPFVYTLRPAPLGENPIDAFLFETRRGFCEHYATSFVTLMRAAGIPARIVTGYQGGEYNPIGDFLRVRQADAHAWAEVWLERSGWVRIDPTAAVAPERVERPLDLADSASDGRLLFRFDDKSLLSRMGLQAQWLIDSVQMTWRRWVVNFDHDRQRDMLAMLGLDRIPVTLLASGAIIAAVLMIGLFALFIMRLNRIVEEPALRLYRRFSAKLARVGLERLDHEGPLDYLQRIASRRPDLAIPARSIIRQYIAIRYGNKDSRQQLDALAKSVRRFSAR